MEQETSHATRKVVFAFLAIFYILFLTYEPYSYANKHIEIGSLEYLFFLFFWIFNQILSMVHEAGHGICYILPFCPDIVTSSMGTIFQIGLPSLIAIYYKKRDNVLGYYIALFFVGFTTTYTAWYIGSAHEGLYVPASKSFLGVDGYHDFNYILNTFGILSFSGFISFLVKVIAHLVMIYACCKIFLYSLLDR